MFKPKRSSIPNNPGVYIYKDRFGEIIYIGKAKNLRNRVSSYFSQNHENSIKTQFLVKNIHDAEYIIVNNEIEALILENKLIKKNKPKYNINLKDSKTYAYLKITNEEIPKIVVARKISDDGEYFGPYTDGQIRNELMNLTVKIFKIITNKTYSTKSKLNYEIGIAPAQSLEKIEKKEYLKNVKAAKEFLKGKNRTQTIKLLKEEMLKASEQNKFEIALEKKKQIEAIMHLKEKQSIDLIKNYDQDVIAILEDNEKQKSIITLFNISKGVISGKKEFKFDSDTSVLEDFIKMYYSQNYVPKEIIINQEFWKNEEEKQIIEKYLSQIKGSKANLTNPKKGEKLGLIKLAESNAKLNIGKNTIHHELKNKLNLPKLPIIIECFDMSNFGFKDLVGGMTRWVDKKPDKDNYRKFEIKSFAGKNDDTRAMREVVYRRYSRLKEETSALKMKAQDSLIVENKKYPDLIIIDGGKGHLNSALESLKKLNLENQIPIISIAKGEKRDKNEIYLPNESNPLIFENNSEMMIYLRQIRDSVHNFVINYNRQKRQMKFKKETMK